MKPTKMERRIMDVFIQLDNINKFKIPDDLFHLLKYHYELYFQVKIDYEDFLTGLAKYVLTNDHQICPARRMENLNKCMAS